MAAYTQLHSDPHVRRWPKSTHLEQVLLVIQGLLLLVSEFREGIVKAIIVHELHAP